MFDPLNPNNEQYRWCIYCDADCFEDVPEHGAECPNVTGLWPVTAELILHSCGSCVRGLICRDCDAPFEMGDMYQHEKMQDDPEVNMIICTGCAAARELAL